MEVSRDRLDARREGYDEELDWHTFLLDAFTGGGGYQGRIKRATAGFWGVASQAYSTLASLLRGGRSCMDTYLDQYPREDAKKFQRRKDVAHYLNYVKPTTLIKVGYICRKPHKRNHLPDKVKDWIERTGYDREFRRRVILTSVLGWFPMHIDMPRAKAGEVPGDPYTVLSLPCHLMDYQLDERGELVWAKLVTRSSRKEHWYSESVPVVRYSIWTRADYTIITVIDGQATTEEGPHSFGRVPVISWRADVSVEDAMKAESINADIALEARRLHNLISELDEHIRTQVFALLVWPGTSPAVRPD